MSSWWDNISGATSAEQVSTAQAQQATFEQQYLAQQAAENSPAAFQAKVKSYGTILMYVVIALVIIVVIKKVFFK
jgi:hypothetical protein